MCGIKIEEKRITNGNAGILDTYISAESSKTEKSRIFLDFGNVEYISSAGIRVLLEACRQKGHEITILNAKQVVRDTLEVTGLDSFISVHAPFKTISVEGCRELGHGWYGTVYRLDEDRIVKIYNDNPANTLENIENERILSRKIYLKGLPCAAVYNIVKTADGRTGAEYEFLSGRTIAELMTEHPEKTEEYGENMGRLLKRVHETTFESGEFPTCRDYMTRLINSSARKLSDEDMALIEEFMDVMDKHRFLLHSDYNPGNVMLCEGQYVLIDMGNAFLGHPVMELGARYPILLFNPEVAKLPETIKDPNVRLYKSLIRSYFGNVSEEKLSDIDVRLKALSAFMLYFSQSIAPEGQMDGIGSIAEAAKAVYLGMKEELFPIEKWWVY